MKGTHLYERLSTVIGYHAVMNFIRKEEESLAKQAFINVTNEASDHPKYQGLKMVYEQRFGPVS